MVGLAVALLLTGSATAAPDIGTGDLSQLFISACLDGQAKLSPGTAQAVTFGDLPRDLRERLGSPASSQVWRLNGGGNAFLYLLGYADPRAAQSRICGVAADQMDYLAAADAVEKRVMGATYPKDGRKIRWTDPKGGYTAMVTKAGTFDVLQVNWMTDKMRAEVLKSYGPLAE